MTNGINAELNELIALRRYAQKTSHKVERSALQAGPHASTLRGRGMDFAEVRNYQAGDEIRHMEWRVTARTGRPHVKLYQEERERPVVLLTDFNPSMYFGTRRAFKSVVAAHLSAIIAWTAMSQGDKVGGLVYSANEHSEFMPRGRERGVLPLLASLSHYTFAGSTSKKGPRPLSDALLRLRRVTKPGSILVILSDFYHLDSESEQYLSRLRTHNNVLAYHICDPLELMPPKPARYAMTDGVAEILLDTTNKDISKAYQCYGEERVIFLQAVFKRLQIQYMQVTAEMDLPKVVWQTFPRRRHG